MLSQSYRLRKRNDFTLLFRRGNYIGAPDLVIKYRPNRMPISRYAVIVSKKVSKKAVERNKLRRRIHEIIRLHQSELSIGYDVMIMTKAPLLKYKYKELETLVLKQLSKLNGKLASKASHGRS